MSQFFLFIYVDKKVVLAYFNINFKRTRKIFLNFYSVYSVFLVFNIVFVPRKYALFSSTVNPWESYGSQV
jgi:hypothetical protein